MSKLILAAALLCAVNAHAFEMPRAGFTDPETRSKVQDTVAGIQVENDFSQRYEKLLELEAFVGQKLQTIDLPDFATAQGNDPKLKNYNSLNEFDNNLELLKQNLRAPSACAQVRAEIGSTTNTNMEASAEQAPETFITLEILKALCR